MEYFCPYIMVEIEDLEWDQEFDCKSRDGESYRCTVSGYNDDGRHEITVDEVTGIRTKLDTETDMVDHGLNYGRPEMSIGFYGKTDCYWSGSYIICE